MNEICSKYDEICRLLFLRQFLSFLVKKSLKIFFFKTAGQTALIFGIQVPRGNLIQIFSNCDEICKFVFLRQFLATIDYSL